MVWKVSALAKLWSYPRRNSTAVAGILLAGCTPTAETTYWRDGATGRQWDQAITQCQVQALREVPQSVAVGSTPTYQTPTQTSCYTIGNTVQCSTTGGQVYGGQVYSYDPNAGLRSRVEAQCMANRGYALVTIPTCTSEQRSAGTLRPLSGRLPPFSSVVCTFEGSFILDLPPA
jgi:hypothetical protein